MSRITQPVSPRRIEANRRNALKSTGPRTPEGKARSSRNATTHGIFCHDMVLPDEDPKEFESYRIPLLRGLEPRNGLEQELAEQVVSLGWKLRRLRRIENAILEERMKPTDEAPDGLSSIHVLAQMFMEEDPALERLAKHERRLQSTMNQLIGRLKQCQKMCEHGILHDHAAKLINFQDPERAGEHVRAKNEPNENGIHPQAEVYERWEQPPEDSTAGAIVAQQAPEAHPDREDETPEEVDELMSLMAT
jgi:hypothetical protein